MDKEPVDVLCAERDGCRTKPDEPVAENVDGSFLSQCWNLVGRFGGAWFSDGGCGVVCCLCDDIGGISPAGHWGLGDG